MGREKKYPINPKKIRNEEKRKQDRRGKEKAQTKMEGINLKIFCVIININGVNVQLKDKDCHLDEKQQQNPTKCYL